VARPVLAAPGTGHEQDTPQGGQACKESPGATRHQPWPVPAGMPGTDMPRLTGMQEVSGSSPLSSTGQKRNSKSRQRVQQESSATAAGWAVVRVFGSGIFPRLTLLARHRIPGAGKPVTCTYRRVIGPVTLAAWSPPGPSGGPFLPVTVAAFARAWLRWRSDPIPGPAPRWPGPRVR
jgi:hypothetical protein